jgi:hypothetical protein
MRPNIQEVRLDGSGFLHDGNYAHILDEAARSPLNLRPIKIPELAAVTFAGGLIDLLKEQRRNLVRCCDLKLVRYRVVEILEHGCD